jgi:hypothetical protein
MNEHFQPADADEADRFLTIYLRDHHAGSSAGLSLAGRCRANNAGTPLETMLAAVESEIREDRLTLEALMRRLDVSPNPVKSALGTLSEMVARVKSNGRVFHYSPLSRVVELETLSAGVLAKRNLWRSLRSAAGREGMLTLEELERLIERATSQHERVLAAHAEAAALAFSAATSASRAA